MGTNTTSCSITVALVNKFLDSFKEIKKNLLLREVNVIEIASIDKLAEANANTLVCSERDESNIGGASHLLSKARNSKITKVIILNEGAQSFSVKKELNWALIRISFNKMDDYCREVILGQCTNKFTFVAGSSSSYSMLSLARRVAETDVTVFINGPTGTGKEVVANYIHEKSTRKEQSFVAVNCAAIPENMLEAMLFGHEKGSFTGASQANKGIFRAADGGTLLLDEISEMPLSLQAKLLRVLQEKKVTPVGGTRDIDIDVRIIATTNRNMSSEVRESRFREDLYYRLNVFPIKTMNLEERKEDIIPITVAIIMKHLKSGQNIPFLTKDAKNTLMKYNWPGNVRELENVIQRSLVLSQSDLIKNEHIMIDDALNLDSQLYNENLEKRLAIASSA